MPEPNFIFSRTNGLAKKIVKLGTRKYRAQFGEYIAEGKRWINDARRLSPQSIVSVIRAQSAECEFADYVFSDELFSELSDTESSQGVMAIMKIPKEPNDFSGNFCLYLDKVRDPGNMGTIIRTALAAGFYDIVLDDCVDVFGPKVIRSSMTGILGINLHFSCDLDDLRTAGYKIISATLDGKNVFEHKELAEKICIVIGNEANGISREIIDRSDYGVTIPMCDGVESLNAAVSAAILMYQFKYNK